MKKILYLLVLAVMTALFFSLDRYNETAFLRTEAAYRDSTTVNLDATLNPEVFQRILFAHGYVPTREDARFVADFLVSRFREDTLPESVQALGSARFGLPAAWVGQYGTDTYRRLLDESYVRTGWDNEAERLSMGSTLPSTVVLHDSLPGSIDVQVSHRIPAGRLPAWKAFFGWNREPASRILVRLDTHRLGPDRTPQVHTVAYAMSDDDGKVCFSGLDPDVSYSVLPVHRDMTFGPSKGTTEGSLGLQDNDARLSFSFVSSPRSVRALTADALLRMRQDGTVTVRTPQMYRDVFRTAVTSFLVVWLVIFIVGNWRRRMDNLLAMLLMGISFGGMILHFAINDALTARMQGLQMTQGIIMGGIAIAVMLCIDWARFFRGGYWVKFNFMYSLLFFPFRLLAAIGGGRLLDFLGISKAKRRALADFPGIGYLMMAILLTAALFVFGHSVGGMKVNLVIGGVPVQPSEIVKFLWVIFMAAFFALRGDRLVGYSTVPLWKEGQVTAVTLMHRKMKVMAGMLMTFAALILMYLLLGDMGPALVILLTFNTLYSLMKSRIETGNWRKSLDEISQCDLVRLLVGVATFIACLLIGMLLDRVGIPKLHMGFPVEYRALMAVLWFLAWILYGYRKKSIEETPVLFNLVIVAFIYGSSLLHAMDLTHAAERLQDRTDICLNTFGELGTEEENRPTVNAQTAIGLYALATGGPTGQGWGCQPNRIPAYHTDFILQSLGLMGGFWMLLLVFLVYALMGWRGLLAGYRSKNNFLLFLCAGIVIVTAVQTLVIAAGSLGLVPMSGLVVPWLSYGRVSLCFHLLAWGIILSVSAHDNGLKANPNRPFGHTLALLSMVYAFFWIIIVGTLFRYMVMDRDGTLGRQLYVTNAQGLNVIQPNPFIEAVVRSMHSGDIRDRNGVLLATSRAERLVGEAQSAAYAKAGLGQLDSLARMVQKRYYPFGSHLAFWVGNANSGLFFHSVDTWERGYLSEARHLSELRGYNNILLDKKGRPVQVDLHSPQFKPGRYLPPCDTVIRGVQLRDYRAVLPIVKGTAGQGWFSWDGEVTTSVSPKDIQLTVDAVLQTRLQQQMQDWTYRIQPNRFAPVERRSVVVIDAADGDVLASAVWPLPDDMRLAAEEDVYRDSDRPDTWSAMTDMDLGLLYGTAPGSTAKVMSALAAVDYANRTGVSLNNRRFMYSVQAKEQIHASARTLGNVSFHDAIVYSSNCYFINQVNDLDLYGRLAGIYAEAGINTGNGLPYRLLYRTPGKQWLERISKQADGATVKYRKYMEGRTRGNFRKMNDWHISHPVWQWAWGQGLTATPVAMARVVAATVDGGMPVTRFRLDVRPKRVQLVDDGPNLNLLRQAMRDETLKLKTATPQMAKAGVFGKSGTAERDYRGPLYKDGTVNGKVNDAWYTCVVPRCRVTRMVNGKQFEDIHPIAIAVRIERTAAMSGAARMMTEEVVMPVLAELGYVPVPE